jgi:acetyl esterase
MEWLWDAYAPDKNDRRTSKASPLNASIDELKGLPPMLMITDEIDIFRDEGEAYAAKVSRAGVEVTAVRVPGTIHDFVSETPSLKPRPRAPRFSLRH